MTDQVEKARRFLDLHRGERPLLLPNPWDRGSAVLLACLGFQALATTSSGARGHPGRANGQVTRDQALEHAAWIVQATDLPVTADLESGFADEPAGVAETVRLAAAAGLAGCSVEGLHRRHRRPQSTTPAWPRPGSRPRCRGRGSRPPTRRPSTWC